MYLLVGFICIMRETDLDSAKSENYIYTDYNEYFFSERNDFTSINPITGHFPGVYLKPIYAGEKITINESYVGVVFPVTMALRDRNWHYNPQANCGFIYRDTRFKYIDIQPVENAKNPIVVFHDAVHMRNMNCVVRGEFSAPDEPLRFKFHHTNNLKPVLVSGAGFDIPDAYQFTKREFFTRIYSALHIARNDGLYSAHRARIEKEIERVGKLHFDGDALLTEEFVKGMVSFKLLRELLRCRHSLLA